jgi:pimeloyl-ACP methyl ester carboxylesterase
LSASKAAPHPPVEAWADIGDLRVRYLDWGGDGPPVVLLHGLASSAHWYDLTAPHLREQYRLIAPDQRGHGQTSQAESGYDWAALTQDVVGLLDHLGIDRAAVFGHSWGATVALNVAARRPDRVTALGLLDGGTSRDANDNSTWEEVRARVRPRDVSGTREQFLDRLRHQLSFCWNAEVERIVQTMVYEDTDGQIQDILRPENHLRVMRAMWEVAASQAYSTVACPTIIIPAGPKPERANTERARVKEVRVAAAAEAIANCRVRWIPETVHDIGYDKPEELAGVMREFLAQALSTVSSSP